MRLIIPLICEDYLIEGEFRKLKWCHPDPVDLPFPCMHGLTDFCNPACPAYFVGGRVSEILQLSLSESRVYLSSSMAYDRARGPHMVSDKCINRWSVSSTH